MGWALATLAAVGLGTVELVGTLRRLEGLTDEHQHYQLSVRFWGVLGLLGLALVALFVQPIAAVGWLSTLPGRAAAAGLALLPGAVAFTGLRNACRLALAHARRAPALASGITVPARVISRSRPALGQDLMEVVLELELPAAEPASLGYRRGDQRPVRRVRVAETCASDHWDRFCPGQRAAVQVQPERPESFALLLHTPPALAPAGQTSSA